MANFDNISFSHLIRLWGIPMRILQDAGLDVVLLALFGTSAVVVLMVCLLGLISLSTNWEGDILGELLPLRPHKMSRETKPFVGGQIRWQTLNASLRDDKP
jgi:hypothetical protein